VISLRNWFGEGCSNADQIRGEDRQLDLRVVVAVKRDCLFCSFETYNRADLFERSDVLPESGSAADKNDEEYKKTFHICLQD
jgi:hypothetical protein